MNFGKNKRKAIARAKKMLREQGFGRKDWGFEIKEEKGFVYITPIKKMGKTVDITFGSSFGSSRLKGVNNDRINKAN